MSGFRKAVPKQAAIKMSMFGPPGSGKTASALLFAEGIARVTGKRVAFVDTERGTDFYAMAVADRKFHPAAFDFDAIYTRSISEVHKNVMQLDPAEHGIVVLDSMSHLWDAAIAAYTGHKTRAGTIPMNAWTGIKRPYKALMKFLIDSPYHVFLLGRQANVFEEDSDTGEMRAAGVKMRAEGETAYEPHICLRMAAERTVKNEKGKSVMAKEQIITAYAEKDRTGTLQGKMIAFPTFANVIAPILGLMSGEQGATPSDEDAAQQDAEAANNAARDREQHSKDLATRYKARFQLAEDADALKQIAAELTPAMKRQLTGQDLTEVRNAYCARDDTLKGLTAPKDTTYAPDDSEAA